MSIFDKVKHFVGAVAAGVVVVSQTATHLPAWLVSVAAVLTFATGATTNPLLKKPDPK